MAGLQRERLDDGIEVLRLDRPEVRNALDSATLAELEAALAELAGDDELRVLVFSTTSSRALSAGADVGEQLEASAVELARSLAGFPPAGMRQLKRMFRELEGTADRVARENELLVDFQRQGAGLPRRRRS